uniref:Laminin subunit alpha-1 n=1 Tax=Equus asinus asinus TaxID=83772 RepID=A0A8C4MP16_EQUAS
EGALARNWGVLLMSSGWRGEQRESLFPAILNLASNAHISTNATCGEQGPEMFCKLVEHVPGRPVRNPQCRICDGSSGNPKERHPISNAIDGTNNWWQSPSIQNGREYHWVTITLDLRQVFQVAYVIIKAANAPRPGNWILERSVDGTKFSPWQYYAVSDTECLTRYNITPRRGPPTYRADDEVICTSYYSRLVPLEHGEIHTSLINGRPSADDLSPELLEFTSAQYIRLRLQRIRTLNADLMTLSRRDPKDLDPIVTRRYYYSIKDISVGGMCICYGHASSCPWDETKLQCQCEHNTCGESCSTCCPGYHQQPWRPGTVSSGNTCEECNCHNKAKDCYYDESVANQKRSLNTAGQFKGGGVCINCLQNTMGINCETCIDGYYRPHKVSPYEDDPCHPCDCDPLGSLSSVCIKDDLHSDLHKGQCPCKEGYTGEKCDRCQFGYKGYPACVLCDCSPAGSVNEDPCSEPCLCKENVEGKNCDGCKPGFYNLKKGNPQGCSECFCFGVSDVCDSLSWPISQVKDMSGWLVTDLISPSKIPSQQNALGGRPQLSINHTSVMQRLTSKYYWSAPEAYLGNKLTAFGGFLKYTVSYDVPVETVDSDLVSHSDVIIKGNGLTLSTQAEGLPLEPYEEYLNVVRLVPENFREFGNKREIDRDRLMTVLANVTHLLIRASYNSAKMALYRLDSVSLDTASPNVIDLALAEDVERCECPPGYMGVSCESCLPGYYRVDGILFGGICQPCECHGHAAQCDVHGVCSACKHNTTGDHCEQCMPGFYGRASRGTPGDCQPCACPLSTASNNFSPTCHLDDGDKVVCDQCAPGYSGAWCERCADGYYGNPTVPGESCVPCNCSGNVDPLEVGHCDSVTGECLRCTGNTDGAHCERCAAGYYGDAVTAKNCRACECHGQGSLSGVCHLETGLCDCKPHVTGQQCDQCLRGYYGLDTGLGCSPCNCSASGSTSDDCTEEGQCRCVPGVAGERCDRCARGFYAYQDGSCTRCDCAHTQNTCDPASGECVCPPHTRGVTCEECGDGYWGHDPELGCQPCNCSHVGSASRQCDALTGHCQCKPAFSGPSCGQCSLGYRDFPDCVACDCDLRGTLADTCDGEQGLCSCAEDTGTCSCKENVVGLHCSECRAGTYALRADDALGCAPCFCFGLSQLCSEAEGYVRTPVTLRPHQPLLRVVSQSDLRGTTQGVYYQAPDILLDAATVRQHVPAEPLYWRLPGQFQGDQLVAYGGKLKYSVAFYSSNGVGTFNLEPQVLIKGGRTRKQVIYVDAPAPENGVRQEQEVGMKENFWKYFNSVSEKPVTRSDFMSVLSNIEYILIKASYGQGLQQSREMSIQGLCPFFNQVLCSLPFASPQDCAPGYHRGKLPEGCGGGPRPLLAPCVPCTCNNHSDACDPDTGTCLNCSDNTAGDHCDVCAPGYYGKVTGSASDCTLCACPHSRPASFSPTCVLEGDHDFRCDACLLGYEGQYCERCSSGYHGNPRAPGGTCQSCDCSPRGSVHSDCDRRSGQCVCRPGATGLRCEECEPRHILVESDCISCDDVCVGVLLSDLDNIGDNVLSVNLTSIIPAPYGILSNLENTTKYLQVGTGNSEVDRNTCHRETELTGSRSHCWCPAQVGLGNVKRVSLNATSATHVHSSVQSRIEASEKLAQGALRTGTEAGLVRDAPWASVRTLLCEAVRDCSIKVLEKRGALGKCMSLVRFSYIYPNVRDVITRIFCFMQRISNEQLISRVLPHPNPCQLSCHLVLALLAGRKVKDVETQANLLFDRLKPLKTLEENLSRNLSEIKLLISQARKQAASIKVAVSADRDCIRAYQPQISSTNYNTLTLNVKTSEPDNLLFYLGSSTSSDFLAVEMRRGKVAFLWDMGSGSARLEFPDFPIDDDKWHSISVTRFGNVGSLSVREMSATQKPPARTRKSPGTANVLEINNSTLMFVGGLGGHIKKSPAVKVTHFKGCMGEAFLNGQSVGLWNYIEREGTCHGCFGSPQSDDSSFHFDGSGYSVVEKTLRATVTQIIMLFSTFSPNGLLLYLASNDFLSIELVHGRIKVTVDLGSGPLALTFLQNDTWKHSFLICRSIFIPSFKNGIIKPKFHHRCSHVLPCRKGVTSKSYVGCIKNLEISRSTFDLLRNSYGVRKGCVLEVGSIFVSFLKGGYVELPPKSLSPESELLATFATKNSSGIILAALGKQGQKQGPRQAHGVSEQLRRYGCRATSKTYSCLRAWLLFSSRLSVQLSLRTFASSGLIYYMAHQNHVDYATLQLLGGRLHFLFDLGKGRTKVSHPALLNDGKWHTVRSQELVITRLNGTALDVEGKLYLGGLPSDYRPRDTGHVSRLSSAGKQLDKDSPVSAFAVTRCYAVAQEGTFFEGSGYAAFEGYRVGSDVNITLEFRTSSENGVLLGISSAKVDAIGLEIILFHVNNGAGRVTATYEPKATSAVCDGKWHTLQANKSKHRVVLIVDGNAVRAESPHPQSTSADTNNPIYVGGYPGTQTSFRGCLRKLALLHGPQVQSCDFSRAFDLQGVFPHSCPGAEP